MSKWPRWLVANWDSKPCGVTRRGGNITPALLMSTSTPMPSRRIAAANARTESRSARSSGRNSTAAAGCAALIRATASRPFAWLREAITTRPPWAASSRLVSNPRPLLAPVTMKVRPD